MIIDDAGIGNVLRASTIQRWNMVDVTRPQSMAEHAFNVCAIVRSICARLNYRNDALIAAALDHDLSEIVTGDIPTPTKQKLRDRGISVDDLVPWGSEWKDGLSQEDRFILKAADYIESLVFLDTHGQTKYGKLVYDRIFWNFNAHMEAHKEKWASTAKAIWAVSAACYVTSLP